MFKFLYKNIFDFDTNSFGLDLSDNSFKFIKFEKNGHMLKAASFGHCGIKDGIIKHGEIQDEDILADIIKDGLKKPTKGELNSKYVVCSLPEENSFIKILQMPKMNMDEMKEAVKWEIEQNIPLKIDDVYFDWSIINVKSNKIDHQDVLISAISKKVADPYVSVLKKAGLMPVAMEVESIPLARSLIKNFKTNRPTLIVDIGAIRSTFVIFSGRTIKLSSSVSLAGGKMIEAIEKSLKVSKSEANKMFFNIGIDESLDKDGKIKEAVDPILLKILSQINNYISFYSGHSMHDHNVKKRNIEKIILSGGVSNLKGLSRFISLKTKMPVELANPWVNVFNKFEGEVPKINHKESLSYSIAIGLALRDYDI